MGVLRLLAPDQSGLLFDFTAPTGTGNPNTLVTELSAGVDFGTVQPALAISMMEAGASLDGMELPPVEVALGFTATAATDDDLWAGLGQLARYLIQASTEHPVYLEWTELGTTYYYDVVGALELPALFRGQGVGAVVSSRRNSMGPIPIRVLRQPWRRGAPVTTSADVVEDDPATGTPDQSRIAAFTVTGDLPTPCKVRAQMDTGSKVVQVLMGHRWRGSRPSTYLTDYRDETAWFQCEATNRGWTITLENDTAAATDGALASPGSGNVVAQVNGGGTTVGTMLRRMRATRTTLMDSLRGSWRPYLRVKATSADTSWEIQLKWAASAATGTPMIEEATYTHRTLEAGQVGYVEVPLGRIDVPEVAALSGLAVEIHARRLVGGAGNLNMDFVWLPPAELTAVNVPQGPTTTVLGKDLATPVTNPAGGTAGTPNGDQLNLDTTTDNAGISPNTGRVFPAGLWRALFRTGTGTGSATAKVRNITGSSDTATVTITSPLARYALDWTAAGAVAYQLQVDDPPGTNMSVAEISYLPLYTVPDTFSVRTDPGPRRYAADLLDASGNLAGYLDAAGAMPLMGRPGDNQLVIAAHEVALPGYAELENLLDRDITVTVTFEPRYAL